MILFNRFSSATFSFVCDIGRVALFFLRVLIAFFGKPFYGTQAAEQLRVMSVLSAPLAAMTALFTGMVLALQSYASMARLSSATILPEIVLLSLTRELAPVLTALMMSGRWGASIAAEIATMRITDQLDALVTLSTNPLRYLVVPRVLAATLSMPILTLVADIIGVIGGYIIGVYHFHLHGPQYFSHTISLISWTDVSLGLVKACVFGFLIAFLGCYEGYYATGGAQGVGRATTRGVVTSCVLILITNYFLTALLLHPR